jgi:hypothetical protein
MVKTKFHQPFRLETTVSARALSHRAGSEAGREQPQARNPSLAMHFGLRPSSGARRRLAFRAGKEPKVYSLGRGRAAPPLDSRPAPE